MTKKKIVWALAAVIIIMQFISLDKNRGEPYGSNDYTQVLPVSDEVKQIIETSCLDCHSNNTIYPWYSSLQPLGWWIQHHVNEGKDELNFSEFATYKVKRQLHKLEEVIEMTEKHEMPLPSYTLIHKNAELSAQQQQALVDWARQGIATIKSNKFSE